MRTTLDLPDDLFRQVKARAALEGASLKVLLARYIEYGLRHDHNNNASRVKRSVIPVIPSCRDELKEKTGGQRGGADGD